MLNSVPVCEIFWTCARGTAIIDDLRKTLNSPYPFYILEISFVLSKDFFWIPMMNVDGAEGTVEAIAGLSVQEKQLFQETEDILMTGTESIEEEHNSIVESFYVHGGNNHVTSMTNFTIDGFYELLKQVAPEVDCSFKKGKEKCTSNSLWNLFFMLLVGHHAGCT